MAMTTAKLPRPIRGHRVWWRSMFGEWLSGVYLRSERHGGRSSWLVRLHHGGVALLDFGGNLAVDMSTVTVERESAPN